MKLFYVLAFLTFIAAGDVRAARLEGFARFGDSLLPGVTLRVSDCAVVVGELVTGADGRYAFDLPAGTYVLTAELPGLDTIRRDVCVQSDARYDLWMSLSHISHSVTLMRDGTRVKATKRKAQGRVVNHSLTPLAGVVVRISRSPVYEIQQLRDVTWQRVEIVPAKSVSVATDSKGEFSCELSAIGPARVTVIAPGHQQEAFTLDTASVASRQITLLPSCV